MTKPPWGRLVPAAGSWLITWPTGAASFACVSEPSTRPAAISVFWAFVMSIFVMFGTVPVCLPLEMVSVTVDPVLTPTPPEGACEMTLPTATLSDESSTTVTSRPSTSICAVASPTLAPCTFGTVTRFGPEETWSSMVVPVGTFPPGFGRIAMTSPSGASAEVCLVMRTTSPSCSRVAVASACVCPTRSGISTSALVVAVDAVVVPPPSDPPRVKA